MSSDQSLLTDALAVSNRRSFLRRAGLASVAGAVAPALAPLFAPSTAQAAQTPSASLDLAILNFALNLEYLEAQYYTYAVTGGSLEQAGIATAGGDGTAAGTVAIKANPQVPFADEFIAQYAAEIATDEQNHVKFLRQTLGANAVAQPNLDLLNSFNGLAQLAGLGDSFDPFASDLNFLLGAFVFEDVGVTAYRGAAPLIYNTAAYIPAASGILAVEAIHAGTIRAILYNMGQEQILTTNVVNPNPPPVIIPDIVTMVQAISDARDGVDNVKKDKDQGIADDAGNANIAPTDKNGLAFARSTNQVLRVVYGMTSASATTPSAGTFFPNRMNGVIR